MTCPNDGGIFTRHRQEEDEIPSVFDRRRSAFWVPARGGDAGPAVA